jgi:ABC-type Fe3+ transport system permease subunit
LIAPAIGFSIGGQRAWEWLEARSILGFPLDDLVRWSALAWVGLATGAPIVALATSASLRKLEPAWLDSARSAGATQFQIWREIIWPIVRADAASACAAVYTLILIEPAGPLVLGLNRTLARAILDAASRLDQPTRPASLALLAILIATIGRTLIGWWGGSSFSRPAFVSVATVNRTKLRTAWLCRLILVAWVGLMVGPLVLLLVKALEVFPLVHFVSSQLVFDDRQLHGWLANSMTTAGLAFLLDMIILRALLGRRESRSDRILGTVTTFLRGIPPLALGVGVFAIPWLLGAMGDLVGGLPRTWIRGIVLELNPARSPGILLILVVAAGKLPILFQVAELSRADLRPSLVDASKLMGVAENRAELAGQGFWLGFVPGRSVVLFLALASTNLAPALLMTPFSERRTIAPAILLSVVREGSIEPGIACAIVVVLLGKGMAFALASRSRTRSLGEWYRG